MVLVRLPALDRGFGWVTTLWVPETRSSARSGALQSSAASSATPPREIYGTLRIDLATTSP